MNRFDWAALGLFTLAVLLLLSGQGVGDCLLVGLGGLICAVVGSGGKATVRVDTLVVSRSAPEDLDRCR